MSKYTTFKLMFFSIALRYTQKKSGKNFAAFQLSENYFSIVAENPICSRFRFGNHRSSRCPVSSLTKPVRTSRRFSG